MPVTTWIRDALGIPKDVLEIKKLRIEIAQLVEERDRVKRVLVLANRDDIEKYDPKTQRLLKEIALKYLDAYGHEIERPDMYQSWGVWEAQNILKRLNKLSASKRKRKSDTTRN